MQWNISIILKNLICLNDYARTLPFAVSSFSWYELASMIDGGVSESVCDMPNDAGTACGGDPAVGICWLDHLCGFCYFFL